MHDGRRMKYYRRCYNSSPEEISDDWTSNEVVSNVHEFYTLNDLPYKWEIREGLRYKLYTYTNFTQLCDDSKFKPPSDCSNNMITQQGVSSAFNELWVTNLEAQQQGVDATTTYRRNY